MWGILGTWGFGWDNWEAWNLFHFHVLNYNVNSWFKYQVGITCVKSIEENLKNVCKTLFKFINKMKRGSFFVDFVWIIRIILLNSHFCIYFLFLHTFLLWWTNILSYLIFNFLLVTYIYTGQPILFLPIANS